MDFRGDDPQYMHDEFISSSNPGGYHISCPAVPEPDHCYFHQAHLKGLAGPCRLGDECPFRHDKKKISHPDFDKLKLKVLGPDMRVAVSTQVATTPRNSSIEAAPAVEGSSEGHWYSQGLPYRVSLAPSIALGLPCRVGRSDLCGEGPAYVGPSTPTVLDPLCGGVSMNSDSALVTSVPGTSAGDEACYFPLKNGPDMYGGKPPFYHISAHDQRRKPTCCFHYTMNGRCPCGRDNLAFCELGPHVTLPVWQQMERNINMVPWFLPRDVPLALEFHGVPWGIDEHGRTFCFGDDGKRMPQCCLEFLHDGYCSVTDQTAEEELALRLCRKGDCHRGVHLAREAFKIRKLQLNLIPGGSRSKIGSSPDMPPLICDTSKIYGLA